MNESDIEKCVYKSFLRRSSPALSIPDLQVNFQKISGESMRDYGDVVEKVVNEIVDKGFLNYERRGAGMPYLTEGLNFDQWEAKMNPQANNGGFSIGTLNASNVQVGNQNTMNAGVSVDQFVKALETFGGKPEAEKKFIIDKVLAAVGTGADVVAAVAALVAAL